MILLTCTFEGPLHRSPLLSRTCSLYRCLAVLLARSLLTPAKPISISAVPIASPLVAALKHRRGAVDPTSRGDDFFRITILPYDVSAVILELYEHSITTHTITPCLHQAPEHQICSLFRHATFRLLAPNNNLSFYGCSGYKRSSYRMAVLVFGLLAIQSNIMRAINLSLRLKCFSALLVMHAAIKPLV